jgi:small subunit ribosomal protein S8
MGMTDPIGDMLTRIRNGQMVRKDQILVPHSRIKLQICRILWEEGYILEPQVEHPEGGFPMIRVGLKYYQERPVIEEIRRYSKPGCRRYVGKDEMPRVYQGFGISVLSTSRGVISNRQARKYGIGGELLCTVF